MTDREILGGLYLLVLPIVALGKARNWVYRALNREQTRTYIV